MASTLLMNHATPLTQIAYPAASITATYSAAGSFTSPVVMMFIISTLDQPVQVSFDGSIDHVAVPAGSTVPVFIQLNFKDNYIVFQRPNIFVKEIGNPTTGSLYICAFTNT
jgi:hypothetical protein